MSPSRPRALIGLLVNRPKHQRQLVQGDVGQWGRGKDGCLYQTLGVS